MIIILIAYAVRYFLVALFCGLAGFAQAFWLLNDASGDVSFDSYKSSLWSSFLTMLGAALPEFHDSTNASPTMARTLLATFMMVMIILMLNILIAIMGDAFASVRESGAAVWRMEQAMICIEEAYTSSRSLDKTDENVHNHIFVLQYSTDIDTKNDKTELNKMVEENWNMNGTVGTDQ